MAKIQIPVLTSINIEQYREILNECSPTELAELILNRSQEERVLLFSVLSPKLAVAFFKAISFERQQEIVSHLPTKQMSRLLNELSPDDRTAFLEELPSDVINSMIKFLSPDEKSIAMKLLGYPEGSIGRLMSPEYLAIKMNWTVQQVLEYIRNYGRDSETITVIYVIDDQGVLIDDIRIREFLFASLDALVSDIVDHKFVTLSVFDDQEIAINQFRKYNRSALPVVDNKGILLGIVTLDDVLHLADEENTEDIQKFGGVEALDEPYTQISFLRLMQKRGGWLVLLFLGEMLTASAMGVFQNEISKAVVLALFLPLIISSGGNAGSQASTLIIRAMALGEITLKDYWKIMKKEILSGLFLGCLLGMVGFLRVTLWSLFSNIYGTHWLLIALTIFLSLIGVVLWGTLTGSMLPFILRGLKLDPAACSAPFVATIVDVVGLIIYFTIALFVLNGTLL